MVKRILSFLLALCILCTQLPLSFPAAALTSESTGSVRKFDGRKALSEGITPGITPLSEEDGSEDVLASAPVITADTDAVAEVTEPGKWSIFRFVPEVTDVYTFSSSSTSDTYGALADEEGYILKSDDDSGEGNNFSVTAVLEAGTTYFWAATFYSSITGSIPVSLQTTHSYQETVTIPSSCTEDGLATLTCEYCGVSSTRPIPAGHLWKDGICTRCGEVFLLTGPCGDGLTWTLDGQGNLTISGTGDMWNYAPFDTDYIDVDENYYTGENPPWKDYYADIKTLTLQPGVTSIGYYAFWSLTGVTEVVLPEGLTAIGYAAFERCTGLKSVTLPSTLTDLDVCFEYCDTLGQVRFEGPVPKSGGMVFASAPAGLRILYHGATGAWASVPDFWMVPENTEWYDMDSGIAPESFAFTQAEYTLEVGGFLQLTTNADPYVQMILTDWTSEDPDILFVSASGLVTGLRPGTTRVTVRSSDGVYSASCTVTVTDMTIPATKLFTLEGTFETNMGSNHYSVWDDVQTSFLIQTADGLERIQYISGTGVVISRYNAVMELVSEQIMDPELPIFGGFFAGETHHFLLYGQTNHEENNEKEVLRIVRYTKDWVRVDACSIYGINTTQPFRAGNADLAEQNGTLYLHTCHEMYTASDGLNHQANMTFVVDQETMTVTDSWHSVMNISYGYVSHSFGQRIRVAGDYIFRADHGDAYPRSIVLTRAYVGGRISSVSYLDLLPIQGGIGANATGVSLGGLELSSTNCLVVGNSVDQSDANAYDPYGLRNIFLCVADQNLSGSELIWLTDYTEEDSINVHTPQLVKISDDLFLILWEEQEDTYGAPVSTIALLVTGEGTALNEPLTLDCRLSDCQPILTREGLVSWFTGYYQTMELNQLSWRQLLSDPAAVETVLGHRYSAVVTEPTCTQPGYTTYTCINCSHSYTDDHTEPLGHDLSPWETIMEPTCNNSGMERQHCLRCGETRTREIEAAGHDYELTVVEPDCINQGYTVYQCSRCSDSHTDDYVDPLGHEFGEWVVRRKPTCTREGEEYQTCTREGCRYTQYQEIAATGHTYEAAVTEPGCTEGGYTTYTCHCGESYVDDYTDPAGHEFGEWYVVVEASCTSEGEEHRECIRCGLTEARATPFGDHRYTAEITEPTCTEQGYTTYTCPCGDSYTDDFTDPLGHEFDAWYTVTEPGCTTTGEEHRDCIRCDASENRDIPAAGHSYTAEITDPTCTEQGYTTYTCHCGDSYTDDFTDPLGHEFGAWYTVTEPGCTTTGEEHRDCIRCDASESRDIPATGHSHTNAVITEPTCTEQGYTTYTCPCGDSYVDDFVAALGHAWDDIRCVRCGVMQHNPFVDVTEGDFFYEPVLWAVVNGITSGTSATTFSPSQTCTRAQVVTFLWRAMGKPQPTSDENPFTDVAPDSYYYTAVLWAVEHGITAGTGAGTFSPDLSCTRAQVVTFLWRAMGKEQPESENNPFADVDENAYYYIPVLWAVENGITAGTGAGAFSPSNSCTRAQVVTFLHRAMK